VTSVVSLNAALFPLGGLVAGIGSDLIGGPKVITIVMCIIAACLAIGIFLGSLTVRNYRLSQAIETDPVAPALSWSSTMLHLLVPGYLLPNDFEELLITEISKELLH